MDKSSSCIDYLASEINNAYGIPAAIAKIQEVHEKIINRDENIIKADEDERENTDIVPNDLVSQLKNEMGQKKNKSTENMAQALENAIKERLAEGKNINHAVIDDNGYKTYGEDEGR